MRLKRIFFILTFIGFIANIYSQNEEYEVKIQKPVNKWFETSNSRYDKFRPFKEIKLDVTSSFIAPALALEYEYRLNKTIGYGANVFFKFNDTYHYLYPDIWSINPFVSLNILTPYNKFFMEGFNFHIGFKTGQRITNSDNLFDAGIVIGSSAKWNIDRFIFEVSADVIRYFINDSEELEEVSISLGAGIKLGYRFY